MYRLNGKEILNSFHLNSHKLGFYPRTYRKNHLVQQKNRYQYHIKLRLSVLGYVYRLKGSSILCCTQKQIYSKKL